MTAHAAKWTTPSPFWSDLLTAPSAGTMRFGQPVILRFADDNFMEQFLSVLERHPAQIHDFTARPETWQEPATAPKALSLLEPVSQESKLARILKRLRASEERFRSGRIMSANSSTELKPLKLYHPAHQRFYLVTASLVCGLKGLTDHKINTGYQERVGYVVRRLLPPGSLNSSEKLPPFDPSTWDEYAFISGAAATGWRKITRTARGEVSSLVAGEEQLPLFPVHYAEDDGRKRRILAGVIPVGKREAYLGATRSTEPDPLNPPIGTRPKSARVVLFRTQVAEPWKRLIEQADTVGKLVVKDDYCKTQSDRDQKVAGMPNLIKVTREQIQVASWYILLDFATYLDKYLNTFWTVIQDPGKDENDLNSTAEKDLFRALTQEVAPADKDKLISTTKYQRSDVKGSLRAALGALGDPSRKMTDMLNTVIDAYNRAENNPNWPPFLCPLADPQLPVLAPKITDADKPLEEKDEVDVTVAASTVPKPTTDLPEILALLADVDKLVALVARALPTESTAPTPPLPLAAQKVLDHREGWFVIRCVYERPNCGPLHPAVVSEATEPFQMAGFFDPDAPARPIRIPLPIDTSPAGLRKFDKNTAFMISDMLCGQIKRAKGLSFGDLVLSVLPWPFHKDLPVPEAGPCKSDAGMQFGMICTLSIPIITICALILLMIIVSLLDIIFRWIPYFIVCFPLPGFKAKKSA